MLRISLKGVWAYKIRLALTALAIILGVGLISGVYVYTDTISKAFDDIFTNAFSGIDIVVGTESELSFGEGSFLDEAEVASIEEVEGVEQVFPSIQGTGVTLIDAEGEVMGTGLGPTFVANISPPAEGAAETGGFTIEGAYPQGEGEVVFDRDTIEQGGFEVGGPVTVISDRAGRLDMTLTGVAEFSGGDLGGTKWVLFDLPTAQSVLQRPGQLSGASVQVTPGTSVDEVIARIDAQLPDHATVVSGQNTAEEQAAELQSNLSAFTVFLSVFGWVALFVGAFLIYNTFRIVVGQRTRELALLRALGAGRRQVRWIMLIEASVIGLIGALLGIGFGVLIALLLQLALPLIGLDLPTAALVIQPRTVIVGLAAGLGITLVSALVPRLPRLQDRGDGRPPGGRRIPAPPRLSAPRPDGVGRAGAGRGCARLRPLRGHRFRPRPVGLRRGSGVAVIFMAIFVLSPLAAGPITSLLGWMFERPMGASGRLARRNAMRSPPPHGGHRRGGDDQHHPGRSGFDPHRLHPGDHQRGAVQRGSTPRWSYSRPTPRAGLPREDSRPRWPSA